MKEMNLDNCTKQWAIFVYALLRNRHNDLKELFAELISSAKTKDEAGRTATIELNEEFFIKVSTLLTVDFRADIVLRKMAEAGGDKMENEADLQELFKKVAASVKPEDVMADLTQHVAEVTKAEAPQPDASEKGPDEPDPV